MITPEGLHPLAIPLQYLGLHLFGLLLGLESDEPVALGTSSTVADDLDRLDIAERGEELVQVGLGSASAYATNEDTIWHQGSVLDGAAAAIVHAGHDNGRTGRLAQWRRR